MFQFDSHFSKDEGLRKYFLWIKYLSFSKLVPICRFHNNDLIAIIISVIKSSGSLKPLSSFLPAKRNKF